ncbi:ABC transporter permease/substrate binding protein [Weissella koreensis]|uniref:ABC transporter permease/substrate binding protein n=1 Tax=Weissella koreensis TaxID=165096 RepID=UPI0002174927|nr:ABC transporter permease/substrate binding protein [Weissella koreensis]AEJ23203.1 betaine ABC transporter permease and substrate binding protein [Weissella koreensis KACC 15510]MCZ9310708.1 ABC transporter permease/substrate binding protein [Weissella koreensis]
MLNLLLLTSKIPLAEYVEKIVNWLTDNWTGFFGAIQTGGQALMDWSNAALGAIQPIILIIALTIFALLISGKKWTFPLFTALGLLLVWNQGLWSDLIQTTTLVLLSSILAIIIGVPLGIWMSKSNTVDKIVQPLLDLMQTMPGFVYLIPAVAFFGIGAVPGIFASLIFALPPTVRFTSLGIRQVPTEMEEAADSFGSTAWQKLFKVELPLAKSTILAGVNQSIMLALSMVVMASMVGAPGLGQGVLAAVQKADVGSGFVSGFALVILAIVIDRFVQFTNVEPAKQEPKSPMKKWIGAITAVVLLGSMVVGLFHTQQQSKKSVDLVYVQWDSEVASNNVLAEAMRQHGYQVNLTPLDNAVMWQTLANGQADASVSAWLPNTQKAQYQKYHDQLDILGPNLKGARVGLVVPSYMDVDSIDDLQQEADQTITGIEPGAGVVAAAQKAVKEYPNLSGWQVQTSSTGSMAVTLDKAIKQHQPIVITGWSPHWMWQKYDLKYLADPKGVMGKSESLNTMTRKDLKESKPDVYKVMKKFKWQPDDMESVMLDISGGSTPQSAAKKWIKAHQKEVDAWFE